MTREELVEKLGDKNLLVWYDEKYCLEAVKQNGYTLQYVKEQSEAVCLEAVKQNGDALRYVHRNTFRVFMGSQ